MGHNSREEAQELYREYFTNDISFMDLSHVDIVFHGTGTLVLDKITKIGDIFANRATELNLPELRKSGNIFAIRATKLNLPKLRKSGSIYAPRATKLNLPVKKRGIV
jgi:hypothetical protein